MEILKFNKYKKVNENIGSSDLSFVTTLTNKVDEYFLEGSEFALKYNIPITKGDNYSVSDSEFKIRWELDLDAREWGIKDIGVNIKSVTGDFTIEIWGDDEDVPHRIEFDAEAHGFQIKNSLEVKSGTLVPDSIEIDFKNKIVTIS